MLYVRYLYLTKARPIYKREPILSSERILRKDCDSMSEGKVVPVLN
jgi:hypothetical protein